MGEGKEGKVYTSSVAESGSALPGAPSGSELSADWKTSHFGRFADAAAFVRLVQDNPGFWVYDFPLKYLKISLDTRAGGYFVLRDRDDRPIPPQRVVDAISEWRRHIGAPTANPAERQPGSRREDQNNLPPRESKGG